MSNIEDRYGCSIKHFIEDEYSICREERQYALFLYNILRKYHNGNKPERDTAVTKIFEACSIPAKAKIENVFYEATFMRDFFERNRRIVFGDENIEDRLRQKKFSPSKKPPGNDIIFFNTKLIAYVAVEKNLSISDEDKKYNLAHQKIDCSGLSDAEKGLSDAEKDIIRHMMNAKPDIAVIYKEKGQKKLLFLECKFESYESSYKVGKEGKVKQTEIHEKIVKFLCEYCESDTMEAADPCTRIVKFTRKDPEDLDPKKGEIRISDLIKINNEKIFS